MSKRDLTRELNTWCHELGVELNDSEIRLTLYSGDVISIDRHERLPSTIRIHGYPCGLEVLPGAANTIEIRPRSEPTLRRNKLACRKRKKPALPSE